jgi:hypothetical protein
MSERTKAGLQALAMGAASLAFFATVYWFLGAAS